MNAQNPTKTYDNKINEQACPSGDACSSSSYSFGLGDGGRVTISPPAKVKNPPLEDFTVLASGFDTLHLSIDVSWGTMPSLFLYLENLKAKAKEDGEEKRGVIKTPDSSLEWKFTIQSFGANGYEWILNAKDFTLKIGPWLEPKSRPSIFVEIRSETLWHMGAKESVDFLLELLLAQGAKKIKIKPSRVDLCLDLMMPSEFWIKELAELSVTRAQDQTIHAKKRVLTGIVVGKGVISARLYDKPLEISSKSKKNWMYDIWRISSVPEGKKVIRIEFQLRREILIDLGINSVTELFSHYSNVWKYCTEKWLKFRSNPGIHHKQRKTLFWWELVQEGFCGSQNATPLVRCKSISQQKNQYMNQLLGAWSSLVALEKIEEGSEENISTRLSDSLVSVIKYQKSLESDGKDFKEKIKDKISKNSRILSKQSDAFLERQKNGFPLGQ